MATALYPGSFDPFHLGHQSIVEQIIDQYEHVVVAAIGNPEKAGFLPLSGRATLIQAALAEFDNVEVAQHPGLVVDLAIAVGADVLVRGAGKEVRDELVMAAMNARLAEIKTVFVAPAAPVAHIGSRRIRELALAGETDAIGALVPAPVMEALRRVALSGGRR